MLRISSIPAFNDNYIFAIVHEKKKIAYVVDPGDSAPVLAFLKRHQFKLNGILITHHHMDHIGGVDDLVKHYQCPVFGPKSNAIASITHTLTDNDILELADLEIQFTIMAVPGHTLDHIVYYNDSWLFCGDTLFAGGCGRVFEGTYEQMYHSLMKLKALPKHLEVYCAHEYTVANLNFASTVEPNNTAISARLTYAKTLRQKSLSTIPSTLHLELDTNIFLRATDAKDFTHLRQLKDQG